MPSAGMASVQAGISVIISHALALHLGTRGRPPLILKRHRPRAIAQNLARLAANGRHSEGGAALSASVGIQMGAKTHRQRRRSSPPMTKRKSWPSIGGDSMYKHNIGISRAS